MANKQEMDKLEKKNLQLLDQKDSEQQQELEDITLEQEHL